MHSYSFRLCSGLGCALSKTEREQRYETGHEIISKGVK